MKKISVDEKKKNWRAKSAERYSGKGKRAPGNRSARFARRYFFYLTPFFAFFPHGGAWSQANSKATFTRLVGVTFIGAVTEALTITRGKHGGVRWAGHLESFSIISLPGAPSLKNFQISFCKILKNKWYHVKVPLKRFHLNGNNIGFRPQTQKLGLYVLNK